MNEYFKLLNKVMAGKVKENRTGVNTVSKIFHNIELDTFLGKKLHIVTTKKVDPYSVLGELLGFIRGVESAAGFRALGTKVWDANANSPGIDKDHANKWLSNPNRKGTDDVGRIYGAQWRKWEDTKIRPSGIDFNKQGYEEATQFMVNNKMMKVWTRTVDQLANVVDSLSNNPNDRRAIISAWNPGEMEEMSLPPCHVLQHYLCECLTPEERLEAYIVGLEARNIWYNNTVEGVRKGATKTFKEAKGINVDKLDELGAPTHSINLIMYQRSADSILGVPYNITSYSMMLMIMARLTGHAAGKFYYLTGDTHIYANHSAAMHEQLRRTPITENVRFVMDPKLSTLKDFERAVPKNFRVFNYQNLGKLNNPTPMAV